MSDIDVFPLALNRVALILLARRSRVPSVVALQGSYFFRDVSGALVEPTPVTGKAQNQQGKNQ